MEIKESIQIVEYNSKYKSAFKTLNLEWISKYFEMKWQKWLFPQKHKGKKSVGYWDKLLSILQKN